MGWEDRDVKKYINKMIRWLMGLRNSKWVLNGFSLMGSHNPLSPLSLSTFLLAFFNTDANALIRFPFGFGKANPNLLKIYLEGILER